MITQGGTSVRPPPPPPLEPLVELGAAAVDFFVEVGGFAVVIGLVLVAGLEEGRPDSLVVLDETGLEDAGFEDEDALVEDALDDEALVDDFGTST